ncbi:MAG: asparagine synthase (glutamine-hydrolyzing) [Acidobacteria bacterium]|nr:asparagine synthase (glutamine-hydrolyzing) [Acidobacteriota bacterium]MBI3422772.1 asparagine synthase (glutamine-hydrolyzing) [Acidobacteriota bacterium]
MCGICGTAIPRQLNRRVNADSLTRMRDALVHRGPDDAGLWLNGSVGLGQRRLSIVDLGGGHQPLSNQGCAGGEDGTVWIAFNGEIYNHAELRAQLESQGHVYRTSSDTETIVHLYEEFGLAGVEQLRGMFAYAIWDAPQRRLVLTRDRVGIKPLYYLLTEDGTLHFASEIKALLAGRALKPELNYNALSDQFANRYTSGEETLFKGVKRLLPGHTLVWQDGQVELSHYWSLSFSKPAQRLSEADYIEQFRALFRDCVASHLMADVPLGMFLSGGIDSSAIAAVMSGLVKDRIKTFSVAFAEREANELDFARTVAQAYNTDHHEIVVSPTEFFAALPTLIYQEDEPLAHPSSVPLYFVSRLAREHVKVVLTGEGADELLAGYNKYRVTRYNLQLGGVYERLLPGFARHAIKGGIERLDGATRARQILQRTFLCLPASLRDIYFDNFAVFAPPLQQRLFTAETRARLTDTDPYRTMVAYAAESDADNLLDQLLAADMQSYLHELLMKQDQMSMAASIESRVPFLDHRLIEFATHLPVEMKLRGTTTKYILRQAMQGVLPAEILTRKKMGFPVPLGAWFRGPFKHVVDEYVLGERALGRGFFNADYVRELAARQQAGENHAERLWALLNFELWQRRFFDGEALAENTATPAMARAVAL